MQGILFDPSKSYTLTGEGRVTCSAALNLGVLYFVQGKTVSIINTVTEQVYSHELGFFPYRFSELQGEGFWLIGAEGAALLHGETLVRQELGYGLHKVVQGEYHQTSHAPDINGLELTGDYEYLQSAGVQPMKLKPHWGTAVTACVYRGEVLAAFKEGTALTATGNWVTPARTGITPDMSSRFYQHSTGTLVVLALNTCVLYSSDYALSWQVKQTQNKPVYTEGYIWHEQGGVVSVCE